MYLNRILEKLMIKRMKNIAVIFLFLISLIGCTPAEEASSVITESDKKDLVHLKTVLWPKAYGEQDTALLNQILHEDFRLIDDEGSVFSKQDEMVYVSQYGPSYSFFEFKVERLDLFDNGTALVSGTGIMKGVDDEGTYITTYKSSNTLIKDNGNWKAVNSHVSGVKEERYDTAPAE